TERIGVVPQAGNTSYCGGGIPDDSGRQLVLSLKRLNRIRALDAGNYSLVAEAGCILSQVQQAAEAAGRFFPLSIGSQGSCQIGGNLSTNAGGVNVLRYGMMRDLVLGLEVALPGGRVLEGLSTLRKDNTGYDIKSLFLGAEGTLGVITAASFKLFPQPQVRATALAALPDVRAAVTLLGELRESIPEAQRHEGASLKHDISLPVAALPDFVARAAPWISANVPDGRLVAYGHVGDGNLHFNVSQLPGADRERFLARADGV